MSSKTEIERELKEIDTILRNEITLQARLQSELENMKTGLTRFQKLNYARKRDEMLNSIDQVNQRIMEYEAEREVILSHLVALENQLVHPPNPPMVRVPEYANQPIHHPSNLTIVIGIIILIVLIAIMILIFLTFLTRQTCDYM